MKWAIVVLMLASSAGADWLHTPTRTVHVTPTNDVPSEWAKILPPDQRIPEGCAYVTNGWDIANGYATPVLSFYPAPTPPDVQTFPVPVEVPVLILKDAATNASYGFYSVNGTLVGGVFDHASPRDTAAISNRLFSLVKTNEAKLAKAKAEKGGQLQRRIENIERLLGIRD